MEFQCILISISEFILEENFARFFKKKNPRIFFVPQVLLPEVWKPEFPSFSEHGIDDPSDKTSLAITKMRMKNRELDAFLTESHQRSKRSKKEGPFLKPYMLMSGIIEKRGIVPQAVYADERYLGIEIIIIIIIEEFRNSNFHGNFTLHRFSDYYWY
jgi:hypothetical protein